MKSTFSLDLVRQTQQLWEEHFPSVINEDEAVLQLSAVGDFFNLLKEAENRNLCRKKTAKEAVQNPMD